MQIPSPQPIGNMMTPKKPEKRLQPSGSRESPEKIYGATDKIPNKSRPRELPFIYSGTKARGIVTRVYTQELEQLGKDSLSVTADVVKNDEMKSLYGEMPQKALCMSMVASIVDRTGIFFKKSLERTRDSIPFAKLVV